MLRADPGQLQRVFQNLLANALKFTAPDVRPRIVVAARRLDADWELSVADNGIGMDADEAGRAFEMFARLHGPERFGGTGLGLAICRRIVERHGGAVACEAHGEGTRLRCTLPAADREAAAPEHPVGASARAPLRILLSDDVAELRALLRRRLEAEGDMLVVGEAADGATSLRLAAEMQPDVVVLDLELRDLSPVELLLGMRSAAPGAAIVTFSGHEPALVAGAAAQSIDLHVPKTTDLDAVRRAVREIGRRQAEAV
jgi:CheY-like chemotaxis protein